jgi:hypothetical protein
MVDIDPASTIDGPLPAADGTVELRSWMQSTSGPLQRVTTIDARRAWVIGQYVYDQTGKTLLASAVAESHRYYPVEQVSLPDVVTIKLPTANMELKISLGTVQINQLLTDRNQLWTMPTFEGYQQFDLGGAAVGAPLPGRVSSQPLLNGIMPASYPVTPSSTYPVMPAALPAVQAPQSSANAGSLPLYGQRGPAQAARRY